MKERQIKGIMIIFLENFYTYNIINNENSKYIVALTYPFSPFHCYKICHERYQYIDWID